MIVFQCTTCISFHSGRYYQVSTVGQGCPRESFNSLLSLGIPFKSLSYSTMILEYTAKM